MAAAFSSGANAFTDAGGEVLDDVARMAYKRRLAGLEAEIAEAEAWNDTVRIPALRKERQFLKDHLARAYGLMGRPREFSSAAERARVAARKAITAALDRITAADPAPAALLGSGVRTGRFCRYDPDPGRRIDWRTEP